MARKTIEAWIHETLTDSERDGKCSRIVLSHLTGLGRTEIHTLKISEKGAYDPKDLGAMFLGKADVHCQDIRGESRFMLDAYWKSKEVESMFPFVRRGQTENHHGMAFPPTDEGRQAQKMEWTEKFLGSVFQRQNQMDQRQQENEERHLRREEALFDRVDKTHANLMSVMEQNLTYFNMAKELMVTATLDQHKQKMEQLQFERQTKREQKVMDALPMLTNMVTGHEVFPQSVVDTKLIEAIAAKITPEMVGMLDMLGLGDEEKGILIHRINQAKEKFMKEEEHIKQLPTTSLSGEDELTPHVGKNGAH